MKGHTSYINALTFSPCGKLLASGGGDKSVIIWDFEQKTIKRQFTGHSYWVCSLAFSKDGNHLAVGSEK